jgi:hypothetical protein
MTHTRSLIKSEKLQGSKSTLKDLQDQLDLGLVHQFLCKLLGNVLEDIVLQNEVLHGVQLLESASFLHELSEGGIVQF